ncbi:hypothetical protein BDQ17DRAFT_1367947, partial [Cyathus striatus]
HELLHTLIIHTTINRGGSEYGELIGDFEHGITYWGCMVFFADTEYIYTKIIIMERVCLATFYPAPMLSHRSGGQVILPKIEVEPQGQEYFDGIIMSLLIVERMCLSPLFSNDHHR